MAKEFFVKNIETQKFWDGTGFHIDQTHIDQAKKVKSPTVSVLKYMFQNIEAHETEAYFLTPSIDLGDPKTEPGKHVIQSFIAAFSDFKNTHSLRIQQLNTELDKNPSALVNLYWRSIEFVKNKMFLDIDDICRDIDIDFKQKNAKELCDHWVSSKILECDIVPIILWAKGIGLGTHQICHKLGHNKLKDSLTSSPP